MITKVGIFGECDAHVAVIEFQKRGAPHCHMLIWLKDFVMTPQNIDNVISANILSATTPGIKHEVLNVANGVATTVLDIVNTGITDQSRL